MSKAVCPHLDVEASKIIKISVDAQIKRYTDAVDLLRALRLPLTLFCHLHIPIGPKARGRSESTSKGSRS